MKLKSDEQRVLKDWKQYLQWYQKISDQNTPESQKLFNQIMSFQGLETESRAKQEQVFDGVLKLYDLTTWNDHFSDVMDTITDLSEEAASSLTSIPDECELEIGSLIDDNFYDHAKDLKIINDQDDWEYSEIRETMFSLTGLKLQYETLLKRNPKLINHQFPKIKR